MLDDDDAPFWRFAPDTLLKALVRACEEHGDRLDAEIDALIERNELKALRQPWASSTTASARKDPQPTINRLRIELETELPSTLGKLLRLAQLEQQRRYIEKTAGKKAGSPAGELAEDLPARISAALSRERKADMPAATLFHAAFERAREEALVTHGDAPLSPSGDDFDATAFGTLPTGFVLPPADFEKSGRPIPRPYWDAVRNYPFHCPLDLPIGDGTIDWEDDPMPKFGSYDLMTARDSAFAFWAKEARQRFSDLSVHLGMMRDIPRKDEEKTWQWADRAYATVIKRTGAEMPDLHLSRLIDRDYDVLLEDERGQVWWRWAERHWAIKGYLFQQHDYQAADNPFDDDLVNAWLFLLVGRHTTDEWLQPAWLRERLFDWRTVQLFTAPVPAVRYLVPRTALISDEEGPLRAA